MVAVANLRLQKPPHLERSNTAMNITDVALSGSNCFASATPFNPWPARALMGTLALNDGQQ